MSKPIIARFRKYTRFRNYDSGTTIPKLLRAIPKLRLGNDTCLSETTIQKLCRAIQKLRLGNYFVRFRKLRFRNCVVPFRNYDSETISRDSETTITKLFRAIQKQRLGNYCVRFRKYESKLMSHTRSYTYIVALQNCHPLCHIHAFSR